jgi:hypothetical protein
MPLDSLATTTSAASDSVMYAQEFVFKWFLFESNIVYYVAIAIGFFIIFVAYFFGGGKMNKMKIILSIVTGIVIGVFTLPLLLKIAGDSPLVVAFFILIDIIFTAIVACHMYELVVIGTHEAFDNKP